MSGCFHYIFAMLYGDKELMYKILFKDLDTHMESLKEVNKNLPLGHPLKDKMDRDFIKNFTSPIMYGCGKP